MAGTNTSNPRKRTVPRRSAVRIEVPRSNSVYKPSRVGRLKHYWWPCRRPSHRLPIFGRGDRQAEPVEGGQPALPGFAWDRAVLVVDGGGARGGARGLRGERL